MSMQFGVAGFISLPGAFAGSRASISDTTVGATITYYGDVDSIGNDDSDDYIGVKCFSAGAASGKRVVSFSGVPVLGTITVSFRHVVNINTPNVCYARFRILNSSDVEIYSKGTSASGLSASDTTYTKSIQYSAPDGIIKFEFYASVSETAGSSQMDSYGLSATVARLY